MKKKFLSLFLILVFFYCLSVTAFAEGNFTVTFKNDGTMDSGDIRTGQIEQIVSNMQPGDTESITVYLRNSHSGATRWYMWNRVLDSLEASARAGLNIYGGAYSYTLTYKGPSTSKVIFDSSRIGGEGETGWNREGLQEATADLEGYFYLDTLNTGESGSVTLTISLEGETQGNDYQNTVANLEMRFAVELIGGNNQRSAVKTGDENNLTPYYIAMVVVGLLFLYLALDAITDRMYKKGRD